jgi:putative MFS transporter
MVHVQTPTVAAPDRTAVLAGRIERLPQYGFHLRARVLIGTATFFDAYDSLAVAYALPVLVPLFGLTPGQVGTLISIGFVGQIVGAVLAGWVAERFGRIVSLTLSVAIFALASLGAALAWDYTSLFVLRAIQGVGLGGEVPVAAAYLNEVYKAKGRGRFFLLYETIFMVGIVAAGILGYLLVPTVGWRSLFVIGAVPAVLVLFFRRTLPESPRWLAQRGRLDEAEAIVSRMENEASEGGRVALPEPVPAPSAPPQPTRWQELLEGTYRRRTLVVWVLWFTAYLATYGLTTWLPTIYSTVFRLPVQESLGYSLIGSSVLIPSVLAAAVWIDRTGRRRWFTASLLGGGVLLIVLWLLGASSALQVLLVSTLAAALFGSVTSALYLYTPEIYPTRMRALGSSISTAWLRIASAIGPIITGTVVAGYSLATAFLIFGAALIVGAIVVGLFGTETTGEVLEEVSP